MSVVSERSMTARRAAGLGPSSAARPRPRPLGGRGRGYSQSDIGGGSGGDPHLIIPQFSAIASEGMKRPSLAEEWGENTTMLTGNTPSEHSFGGEDGRILEDVPTGRLVTRRCSRVLWLLVATLITVVTVISAPLMVALPHALRYYTLSSTPYVPVECDVECQGSILAIIIKTFLLVLALWAMYWRRAVADLPRLYFARACLAMLVLFELFAFWLFYTVRILIDRQPKYAAFALYLIDVLLYTHYISVIALELRRHRPEFVATIVRDPDGEQRTMMIGKMSIQEAAIEILRFYNAVFPSFNVSLDKLRHSGGHWRSSGLGLGMKMYAIEESGNHEIAPENMRMLMEAMSRRRVSAHAELHNREEEWESRFRKRRYRLIAAAEDAFAQMTSLQPTQNRRNAMNVKSAAETVYSWVAKSLNKFLRLVHSQSHHPSDEVKEHIRRCLENNLSHRTFVQRFTSDRFPIKTAVSESKWSISCNQRASAAVSHGTTFCLICHDHEENIGVQLVCTLSSLPFFNLTEKARGRPTKFALKIAHDVGGGMV